MKVITGELSPRAAEAKAPVDRLVDSGKVGVEVQPSGSDAPPLSGADSVKEAVTVSEAARYALEEKEVMEVAPWNEAVRELRNRILAKMLDSMAGKRISFSDIQDLRRRAEAGEAVTLDETPSLVKHQFEIEARDETLSIDVALELTAREIEEEGFQLMSRVDWKPGRMAFPGDKAQVPFESLSFRMDVGEASPASGDLGLQESAESRVKESDSESAIRVWALSQNKHESSLMGTVQVDSESLSFEKVEGPRGFINTTPVPPHRASNAYREAAIAGDTAPDTKIIL